MQLMLSELPETWRGKVRHSTQLTTSSTWQIQLTRRRKTTHVQTDNVGAGVGFPQQMRGDR